MAAVAAAWLLSVGVERINLSTWVWLLLLLPGLLNVGMELQALVWPLLLVAPAWV